MYFGASSIMEALFGLVGGSRFLPSTLQIAVAEGGPHVCSASSSLCQLSRMAG